MLYILYTYMYAYVHVHLLYRYMYHYIHAKPIFQINFDIHSYRHACEHWYLAYTGKL